MKKATIKIPEKLLQDLLKVIKAKNKTQAVIIAIEDEIKKKKFERIKEMAGKMEFDIEAEEIRHKDERLG